MRLRCLAFVFVLAASAAQAVVIDRIAIIVGSSIIKDSDIARDIRLTDFLNGDPLGFGADARKKAADRLIDQVFIQREIRLGDYPTATVEQAQQNESSLVRSRFNSDQAMEAGLQRYGLTEADLRMHLQWQLTVLQFIDARFRPAAYTTDQQVNDYFNEHRAQLTKQHPQATESQLRMDAQTLMAGEKVNQLFFAWLDEQRKNSKIQYLEDSLK